MALSASQTQGISVLLFLAICASNPCDFHFCFWKSKMYKSPTNPLVFWDNKTALISPAMCKYLMISFFSCWGEVTFFTLQITISSSSHSQHSGISIALNMNPFVCLLLDCVYYRGPNVFEGPVASCEWIPCNHFSVGSSPPNFLLLNLTQWRYKWTMALLHYLMCLPSLV